MYAIVRTGGKQYKVWEKAVFAVEKLDVAEGETIELTDVLLIADGDNIKVGTPTVSGAKVTATVLEQFKGTKIHGYTYIKRKRHERHYGHRQLHTRLRVTAISA